MTASPSLPQSYTALAARIGRIADLQEAAQVLRWDHATMMPPGGAEARARQLAALETQCHEMLLAPDLADWLEAAEGEEGQLGPWERANLREIRRVLRDAGAVPAALVEALSRATSACEVAWRSARPANDYAGMLPLLGEVLGLTRELAAAKAAVLGCDPYDALLQDYELGASSSRIDALFAELEAVLPGILEQAMARQAGTPPPVRPTGPFAVADQQAFGVEVMRVLGFDFDHGRLDQSHHPFTGGVPDDVRLTTRYDAADVLRGLMGTVHETGHALYEQGLPRGFRGQPVGSARGMVLHESQSLLMEMQVARGEPFLRFVSPIAKRLLGPDPALAPTNLARLTRRVGPSLIRVEADEITYPLHVVLRYRLERAMLDGALDLKDVPGAWNDLMQSLLGIAPPDDRDGCLQDVHWYGGSFGYFPTYTLGALAAAQLYAAAGRAVPDLADRLARGEVGPLRQWLRAEVHARGSLLSTDELLIEATGAPLGTEAFRAHLHARYLS